MTGFQDSQVPEKVESLWKYSSGLRQSINLLRVIGYFLLILASLDLMQIFVPPQFTNPSWEFELVGQIVERVAVPLIGLGLIFMGQLVNRSKKERLTLKLLSWLSLLVALLFLLLVPLNIVSAIRIDRQGNEQITAQVEGATGQLQDVKKEVGNITSIEQAEQLLSQLDPQRRTATIQEGQSLEEIKEKVSLSLNRGESQLERRAAADQKSLRRRLLKNALKWDAGALLSSALFFWIWRNTQWARLRK